MFILTGAWGAIKHHFPTADIKGCVFHWSQAVLRKVAKLGLKTAYDQKQSTNNLIPNVAEKNILILVEETNNLIQSFWHKIYC